MKGIILAGGTGSRLHPLTKVTNKHLLPVYNKPMIYYPIETLMKIGIKDIIIVTGREHAGNFLNLLGSGVEFGAHFYYVLQDGAGGIAQALSLTEGIAGNESVVVILGDNIILDDVSQQVKDFKTGAIIFLKEVHDPGRFGVPVFGKTGKKLLKIEEKPNKPQSEYAVTGLYVYDYTVFDRIKKLKPSARGELEITDLNNLYLKDEKLNYAVLKGPWLDAGTFESLFESSKVIKDVLSKK